ncbi:MAG TPA: hypothetical protein VHB27_20820 [Rhodopila sp.]|uniref:cytochrome oxidase putative small subunit CydP n=1 Tax=Rhodopila sp. TaxID=2480087 RepID=UPI002BDD8132|nr:cytochrome oxidase putative small subunit CydP [Rhodopila sp.]HVY17675.1 hypothetical protein [Rhodopila sp.]
MRDRNHAAPGQTRAIGRDLLVLVAVKLVALTLIYWVFFSPSHRPAIDVASHIAGMSWSRQ